MFDPCLDNLSHMHPPSLTFICQRFLSSASQGRYLLCQVCVICDQRVALRAMGPQGPQSYNYDPSLERDPRVTVAQLPFLPGQILRLSTSHTLPMALSFLKTNSQGPWDTGTSSTLPPGIYSTTYFNAMRPRLSICCYCFLNKYQMRDNLEDFHFCFPLILRE